MTHGPPAPREESFAALIERESGLHKSLTARKITMIAIGGAIGTGLFLGSGFAISTAGPSVLVSYGIGAVVALLLMGCLAEMTIAHPTTGSFGAYAEYYLGPLAGFLVLYSYWTASVLGAGTEVTAIALYMQLWFPSAPGWIWIVGFSGALVLINAVSVNVFGSVEYWFSLIKIVAIVAFILLAAYVVFGLPSPQSPSGAPIGLRNYSAHGGFFPHGVAATWQAVVIAVFSYFSIETIAVAAGEAVDPRLAIMRAFRSTLARLILFYLLTLALMLAVIPWSEAGTSESPFVKVMRAFHISGATGVMNFVVLTAALSAMNSQLYVTTRMLFSMARAGHAPRFLGAVTSNGVPLRALLASSSGATVATVLSIVSPGTAFLTMLAISAFGAMFAWMMIFVTHYFFRRRRNEAGAVAGFRMWGFPATPLLGAALMASLLVTTLFTDAFRLTLVFGLPFLVVLTVLYALRSSRRRLILRSESP
jgi:L-asparagine transporter-like permease